MELYGLLRFRIDGVLHEIHRFPVRVHEAIIMRVRLMATGEVGNGSYLDACLHLPLDGHVEDLRISVMPTFLGEALTARLLSRDMIQQMTLDGLGFRAADLLRVFASG